MATNHTENYQLNLWEPTDDFLREEFNENTEKIDAALDTYKTVVGMYEPVDKETPIVVHLGFRPKAVIVFASYAIGVMTDLGLRGIAINPTDHRSEYVGPPGSINDDGFTLEANSGYTYLIGGMGLYIAFR